ncbi:hypothetical protein QF048_003367 [Streptomyces sp. W4I9-2]|nr:hypothetical protein [Streptomyces sp. W4I9-2]
MVRFPVMLAEAIAATPPMMAPPNAPPTPTNATINSAFMGRILPAPTGSINQFGAICDYFLREWLSTVAWRLPSDLQRAASNMPDLWLLTGTSHRGDTWGLRSRSAQERRCLPRRLTPGEHCALLSTDPCAKLLSSEITGSMELSDIGAIAAAGVAADGIPAALLVGRWPFKGQLVAAGTTREVSLRAAEGAARTGVPQAEVTYRAALDAARTTAAADHELTTTQGRKLGAAYAHDLGSFGIH